MVVASGFTVGVPSSSNVTLGLTSRLRWYSQSKRTRTTSINANVPMDDISTATHIINGRTIKSDCGINAWKPSPTAPRNDTNPKMTAMPCPHSIIILMVSYLRVGRKCWLANGLPVRRWILPERRDCSPSRRISRSTSRALTTSVKSSNGGGGRSGVTGRSSRGNSSINSANHRSITNGVLHFGHSTQVWTRRSSAIASWPQCGHFVGTFMPALYGLRRRTAGGIADA